MNSARKDVAKLLSGSFLAKFFSVVSLMLFTRSLSQTQLAVFPAFLMLAGILNIVTTFGLFGSFNRELPGLARTDKEKARSLVLTASAIISVGTILPIVGAWIWSGTVARYVFDTPADGWIIRYMVPGFLAYMVSKIEDYVMWGRGQFGATSVLQVIESIVRPAATVGFWFWLGFPGIVIGLVVSQIVMAAIGFWFVRDMFLAPLPPVYPVKPLLLESMSYYAGNFLTYFRGEGDQLLVTLFLGPAVLAEYYVAKTLYANMILIWTAVDKVAAERLARWVRKPEFPVKTQELYLQICRVTIPFCMLVMAMAPGAMIVLASTRYADAIGPAIALLVAMTFQFVSIPYDRPIYLALPGWVRLKYTAIEAAVAVAAIAILAPTAGLIGVAVARIIGPVAICLFDAWILYRHMDLVLSPKPAMRSALIALPGTILALWLVPIAHNVGQAFVAAAFAGTIWTICFVAFALVFDRRLIEDLFGYARRQLGSGFTAP